MNLPDITHRLLAARNMAKVNAGVQKNLDIGETGPPAATGVTPGPAYPGYSGEPTVIVSPPYEGGLDIPIPEPYTPPDWILPLPAGSTPPEAQLSPEPIDWGIPGAVQEQPYYDPSTENAMIGGLVNWNGPGQANIHDPENQLGGALAARFGLMGVQGGGIDSRSRPRTKMK